MFVQIVNFIERFFIGIGPVVVLFLGCVFSVINLRFGVLGLGVFLEGALHVDRANFKCALGKRCDWKGECRSQSYREKFFHKAELRVVGDALDRNRRDLFKIDNRR